jgi:hypothetical protein
MPPRSLKYEDDLEYDKVKYFTKIFMYNSESFNNIGPIVEIIKNLDKSIISYKYGKNQNTIKIYGSQYFHRVIGINLDKKQEYMDNIINGMVKFIFLFSNSHDHVCSNLLEFSEKYKKCIICYSEIDLRYHFYDFTGNFEKTELLSAIDVINRMKEINDFINFKKIVDLFPEYDIIPEPSIFKEGSLSKCVKILRTRQLEEENKKKENSIRVIPLLKEQPVKKIISNKKPIQVITEKKNLLSKFFKK